MRGGKRRIDDLCVDMEMLINAINIKNTDIRFDILLRNGIYLIFLFTWKYISIDRIISRNWRVSLVQPDLIIGRRVSNKQSGYTSRINGKNISRWLVHCQRVRGNEIWMFRNLVISIWRSSNGVNEPTTNSLTFKNYTERPVLFTLFSLTRSSRQNSNVYSEFSLNYFVRE